VHRGYERKSPPRSGLTKINNLSIPSPPRRTQVPLICTAARPPITKRGEIPVKQFEIRYRHWKHGRRSERTIKVISDTPAAADQQFLKSVPGNRVKILSIYLAEEVV